MLPSASRACAKKVVVDLDDNAALDQVMCGVPVAGNFNDIADNDPFGVSSDILDFQRDDRTEEGRGEKQKAGT